VNQELEKISFPQSQIKGVATIFLKPVIQIQIVEVVQHAKL
jgi:hypothetical protein